MEKKKILLYCIIVLLFLIIVYLIYNKLSGDKTIDKYKDDIMKLENKISDLEKVNKINKESFNTNFIVGKYSYKKHDSSCDVEANLILMEDGTYIYEDSSCSGENKAEGTYALGNNKIYLYNKLCQPVPDSTARKCEYPNCKNIIEFEYEDGKIISNIVTGSRENVTLEKDE